MARKAETHAFQKSHHVVPKQNTFCLFNLIHQRLVVSRLDRTLEGKLIVSHVAEKDQVCTLATVMTIIMTTMASIIRSGALTGESRTNWTAQTGTYLSSQASFSYPKKRRQQKVERMPRKVKLKEAKWMKRREWGKWWR